MFQLRNWPEMPFCRRTRIPVHPTHIRTRPVSPRPHEPVHTCTSSWEVPNGAFTAHTGRGTARDCGDDPRPWPMKTPNATAPTTARHLDEAGPDGWRRDHGRSGMRNINGRNPSTDHRETLRRGLRILARHDRPRPPASAGVPVRGCAGAACGGRGRGLNGSWRQRRGISPGSHIHPPTPPAFCPLP